MFNANYKSSVIETKYEVHIYFCEQIKYEIAN